MRGGKGIEQRGRVRGSKRFLSASVIFRFFKRKGIYDHIYSKKREHKIQLQESSEF